MEGAALRGVCAIILAAGGATRFGGPKLLHPLPGRPHTPLLLAVVETVRAAAPDTIVVVVGAGAPALIALLADQPVEIVENPDWAEGLSASMRAGLGRVPAAAEAALFVLADQPWVQPATLRALGAAYRAGDAAIVVPTYQGRRGNPVLFDRSAFAALGEIRGDQGGRALLRGGQFRVLETPTTDPAILLDVDAPADLREDRPLGS